MIRSIAILLLFALPLGVRAEVEINPQRAKFNYQMFCQGCHTPDGGGHSTVPEMKGFLGHFLKSQAGREYLVRVPGSANSTLDNPQLAEVLNWMLLTFAEDSLAAGWHPYRAEEVGRYRQRPLLEVFDYRDQLVQQLSLSQ